jgi:sensor histidine kinase YesM
MNWKSHAGISWQIRFGDQLHVEVTHDPKWDSLNIPNMILQPIVENAVRHGVECQSELCKISIKTHVGGDLLTITITDTGPGPDYKPDAKRAPGGLGLENVRSRLQHLEHGVAKLSISQNEPRGTRVTIQLPISLK